MLQAKGYAGKARQECRGYLDGEVVQADQTLQVEHAMVSKPQEADEPEAVQLSQMLQPIQALLTEFVPKHDLQAAQLWKILRSVTCHEKHVTLRATCTASRPQESSQHVL